MSSDAVSLALDLLDVDPLAAVRGIAEGGPPDLPALLALAEDALLLAALACAEPDDARCYRVASRVLAMLPHGSDAAAPLPFGVQLVRAAA